MNTKGYGYTHIGKKRKDNEDAFFADDQLGLYLVCDGMGGHLAGGLAARKTAEYTREQVELESGTIEGFRRDATPDSEIIRFVEGLVNSVCGRLHDLSKSRIEYTGMGSTLTFLLTVADRAVMGHVGDSRLYLLRDEEVHLLSDDHTYAHDLARAGIIAAEDEIRSQYGKVLTRSVGSRPLVQADTLLFDLIPGDVFLLCTDGLSRHLEAPEDLLAALDGDPADASRRLVDLANARGGSDNITVVTAAVESPKRTTSASRDHAGAIQNRVKILGGMPVFGDLLMRELLRLANISHLTTVDADVDVQRRGEPVPAYSRVLSGALRVLRSGTEPGRLRPGDSFGLAGLLRDVPARDTIEAVSECQLLRVTGKDLARLARARPRLGQKVYARLAQELAGRSDCV